MSELYIGLMSGTSMDAIDCALVDFKDNRINLIATHSTGYSVEIREGLTALCSSGTDEINRYGQLDRQVGFLFAQGCNELLEKSGYAAKDIRAIGSHGQTVRHHPNIQHPFTMQLGDPNIIAEMTGITTIADFRRRDMVKGGQGAPLTPAFHQFAFRSPTTDRVIVNIGGIANITYLPSDPNKPCIGFDCGPGNTLLDNWAAQHLDQHYDHQGQWAQQGIVQELLLERLMTDSYFEQLPPKSTGREYFNLAWLQTYLEDDSQPCDIQATLAQLTAGTIINAIGQMSSEAEIFLCGGGVLNTDLVARIARLKGPHQVTTTSEVGVHPNWVEAIAFAWLGRQTILGLPGNLPEVTGTAHPCILGGIYLGG